MRKIDKKLNIIKANILVEQRYLAIKGIIKENFGSIDDETTPEKCIFANKNNGHVDFGTNKLSNGDETKTGDYVYRIEYRDLVRTLENITPNYSLDDLTSVGDILIEAEVIGEYRDKSWPVEIVSTEDEAIPNDYDTFGYDDDDAGFPRPGHTW